MSSKVYLSVFIIFLSILFLYLFVYQKYQELSFLKKELSQKEQELENTRRYIRQVKEASEKLKDYSEQLSVIETAIPENLQEPETFHLLQTLSVQSGVTLKSVGKLSPKGENLPKRWITDIVILADYPTFKNFLSTLEKSARIIEINKISFSGTEKKEEIKELHNFNLILGIHSY